MRFFFLLLIFLSYTGISQLDYDTLIERGIYTSYFNTRIKQPVAVVYKLYCGGGSASRNNDHFVTDPEVNTLKASDYSKSGYDKGHLAAAEDFAYCDSLQNLTFRYYNCVPQHPKLNRGKWKRYETITRKLSQSDTVMVVCYNYFDGLCQKKMAIPSICYKGVFDKNGTVIFCIGFENRASGKEVFIGEQILEKMTGLCKRDLPSHHTKNKESH